MICVPSYSKVAYSLDRDRGRYLLTVCPPGFTRTPAELLVEQRQSATIRADADLILSSPKKEVDPQQTTVSGKAKKRRAFFTGLLPTGYAHIFSGDILTQGPYRQTSQAAKVRNFILVRFSPDAATLNMVFFPGFRPFPAERDRFIREVIGRGLL